MTWIGDKYWAARGWFDPTLTPDGWFSDELAALAQALALSPNYGIIQVAGDSPALALYLLLQVSPTSGAAIAGGYAPGYQWGVSASSGAVAVSGNAPGLVAGLTGASGVVVATGGTAAIQLQLGAISPVEGAVCVDGFAPACVLAIAVYEGAAILNGEISTIQQASSGPDLMPLVGMMANTGALLLRS